MQSVTPTAMKELDRRAIEEFGIPGDVLMERAGGGLADALRDAAADLEWSRPAYRMAAGKGNNGGDVFAAARRLGETGADVIVYLAGRPEDLRGDAARHWQRMRDRGVEWRALPQEAEWDACEADAARQVMLVDGLLGTGAKGEPHGVVRGAIRWLRRHAARAFVASVDVPSGVDAETGQAAESAVRADLTVTMALPKTGLLQPVAREYVGEIRVVDIGFPPALTASMEEPPSIGLVTGPEIARILGRRARTGHKGTYGRVLIFSGAAGYAGAAALAAEGALRAGAGLVTVVTAASAAPIVAGAVREAMVHAAPETSSGSIASSCWEDWSRRVDEYDAVLAGPGMTRHAETLVLLRDMVRDVQRVLVLDADALSVFENQAAWLDRARASLILTPHPGEAGRLLGCGPGDVEADRIGSARRLAEAAGGVVVLKGAGSVVAAHGEVPEINMTGNPGMASGGSGDVLAGMTAALAAGSMSPLDAARAAVYTHGRAGDLAARSRSETGLIARDLLDALPRAWRELERGG
jgi:ADP-dependent NAD(P)H-hydrate dehydratase / NAD(P)H-hydrate epimerase